MRTSVDLRRDQSGHSATARGTETARRAQSPARVSSESTHPEVERPRTSLDSAPPPSSPRSSSSEIASTTHASAAWALRASQESASASSVPEDAPQARGWTPRGLFGALMGAGVVVAGVLAAQLGSQPTAWACDLQMKDVAFTRNAHAFTRASGAMEMCLCENAPRGVRAELLNTLTTVFKRDRTLGAIDGRVVLTDIGAGGLLQLAAHIDAALDAQHRSLVVNLIDGRFSPSQCGTYEISSEAPEVRFQRKDRACSDDQRRVAYQGPGTRRDPLRDFLDYLHTQTRSDCRPATIKVEVYQSTQVYAANVQEGRADKPDVLTLVDPGPPSKSVQKNNANLILGRDDAGRFALWIPVGGPPDPRVHLIRPDGRAGKLETALANLPADAKRKSVIKTVRSYAQTLRYFDDASFSYRDLASAAGVPEHRSFFVAGDRVERGSLSPELRAQLAREMFISAAMQG